MDQDVAEAGDDEAAVIARLHTDSWRASYRGILPADYLENEAGAERDEYWRTALRAGDYSLVLMARIGGKPVGFIAVQDGTETGYDATIEHLHVLPQAKGGGVGRRLMALAADRLATRGLVSVCLRVFDANRAAIGFYDRLGGVTDDYGVDDFAGAAAPDRRIGWRDLATLSRACRGDTLS